MGRRIWTLVLLACAFYGRAADVARVYVTLPGVGVKTYLVSDQNEWRLEGTFLAVDKSVKETCVRPPSFVKAGPFFYALDQYADKTLGYFSIARYDAKGIYRGKLVEKYTETGLKADNMTVSPDGAYLYVTCFWGGVLLRVSTADGTVTRLTTDKILTSRGCCTSSDGSIYVANRGGDGVDVYDASGTRQSVRYALYQASGVLCDDEDGKVYVSNSGGILRIYDKGTDEYAEKTGFGNAMALAKVNGKIIIGNWGGVLCSYDPATGTVTTLFTDLGHIQHLHAERLVAQAVPDARTITFAAPASGLWYAARDEGKGAVDASEKTTVWSSADKGATWTVHSTIEGVCHPAVYAGGASVSLVGEQVRSAEAESQTFVGFLYCDGTWSNAFSRTSAGTDLVPAGGMVSAPHIWGGERPAYPVNISSNRSVAILSTLKPGHRLYPDYVHSSTNLEIEAFLGHAAYPNRHVKHPHKTSGIPTTFEGAHGGMITFLPAEQVHTVSHDRLAPEYVNMYTNYLAKQAPALVESVMIPGGSKPLSVTWDDESAAYWAVSMPVTNVTDLLACDPDRIRNVVALSFSTNLHDWTMVRILRAEGTPETVAFTRPCLAVDGDDLVVVYSASGAYDPAVGTPISADGTLTCQRVTDFRSLKTPMTEEPDPLVFLQTDFRYNRVNRYRKNPRTGQLDFDGIFADETGPYGANVSLKGPLGLAATADRVYVTCENAGLFVFTKKGRFLKRYTPPGSHKFDAVVISPDGKTGWFSDLAGSPNGAFKLDFATETWTELVTQTDDETIVGPRALAVAADGTFYLACRGGSFIRHYAADGSSYTVFADDLQGPVCLTLDEENDILYCGTRYGEVRKYDLADENKMTVLLEALPVMDNAAFSILPRDGLLYVVDGNAGIVFTIDPDKPRQIPVPVLGGGIFWGRGLFVDTAPLPGMTVLIR